MEQLCTSQPNKIIHGTLINSIRSYGFLSQTNNVKSSVCVIGPGDVRPDQLFSGDDPPDQYSLPLHTLQIAYAMRLESCLCSSIEALRWAGLRPAWSAHSNRKNSSRPSFFGGLSLLSSSFGGHKKRRRLGLAARARPPRRFTSDELMSSKSKLHFGWLRRLEPIAIDSGCHVFSLVSMLDVYE